MYAAVTRGRGMHRTNSKAGQKVESASLMADVVSVRRA